jgi:hypothetical protein
MTGCAVGGAANDHFGYGVDPAEALDHNLFLPVVAGD